MGRLEKPVFIPDLAAGRHAHAADKTARQVGKDVSEHVLHHHDVEVPRLPHHIERHRIDVAVAGLDFRVTDRHLIENRSEKGLRPEDIRLVDAGKFPGPAAAFSFRCKAKRKFVKLAGRFGADPHDIGNRLRVVRVPLHRGSVMDRGRVEKTFGGLTDDHHVERCGTRVGKSLWRVRIGTDRPHAGVELEPVAKPQMRRYFGAVGMPDRWQSDGAEEYRISRAGARFAIRFDVTAGLGEKGCAGIDVIICRRRRPDTCQGGLRDREGCVGHVGANPVSTNDGNSG